MSLRLEMLQVARLAPKVLGESAGLVRGFLQSRQHPEGGFLDRGGGVDLYYAVFAVDGLFALEEEPRWDSLGEYLQGFGDGEGLDFVHCCCLARLWAARSGSRGEAVPFERRRRLADRIDRFRSQDGGFHPSPGQSFGTVYGAFLGLGAYQDLGLQMAAPMELVRSLKAMETEDGAWANERGVAAGSANATAAAVTVLRNLQMPLNQASIGNWLLNQAHSQGGFKAAPAAPMPDLLSTATALHALAGLQVPLDRVKEPCLDFLDSLWTNEGGFYGHWQEDALDCEYTFYGLLALGHLSV